jgi:hypothetical protein
MGGMATVSDDGKNADRQWPSGENGDTDAILSLVMAFVPRFLMAGKDQV